MLEFLLLKIIRAYQIFISPFLGRNCRFYPNCSSYSYSAIKKYGAARGLKISLKRIIRCNPWRPGGVDPLR